MAAPPARKPAPRTPKATKRVVKASDASSAGVPAQGRELRARGRKTMAKLLDAGVAVFARRGYHAARVDDIVKEAKTSHGTFYLYFSNKEDLFRALVLDVAEQMKGLIAELDEIRPDRSGYEALRTWLGRFADTYERYGPVIRAWTEAEVDTNEFGRIGVETLGEITTTWAARIRAVGPEDLDADVAAMAFVAMIERFNYFLMVGQVDIDRDRVLDTLAGIAHAGIFGGAR